jgi:hypothetical protein
VEARDNRQRDNQPANERQTGGDVPGDKRQQGLDRPRLRCALPSQNLAATALALVAEIAAALIADNADGGNSGVAIVGRASLVAGGGVIK